MDPVRLLQLLEDVRAGRLEPPAALRELEHLPYTDLGFARVDQHRALRQGLPEVVFGEGKSAEQITAIARTLLGAGQSVLVTRVDDAKALQVTASLPALTHDATARVLVHRATGVAPRGGAPVAIVTAGTSDGSVAREAAVTLELVGVTVDAVSDVGVAGIHRLLGEVERLRRAAVLIVIAGMEGALPSVVGGLVARPVIAVPTSVGYGAALGGLTPLLGMLTSCAAGVTVVNIDNGFGAAVAALRILQLTDPKP